VDPPGKVNSTFSFTACEPDTAHKNFILFTVVPFVRTVMSISAPVFVSPSFVPLPSRLPFTAVPVRPTRS